MFDVSLMNILRILMSSFHVYEPINGICILKNCVDRNANTGISNFPCGYNVNYNCVLDVDSKCKTSCSMKITKVYMEFVWKVISLIKIIRTFRNQ
jgi:hypothetical protein